MSASPDLSVIIPARDEGDSIGSLLVRLRKVLAELGIAHEVLVVDGGSADDTGPIAGALGATVLRQPGSGYAEALRLGFAEARGAYLLTMDADFSHDPLFIKDLWGNRAAAELVIASRYIPGGRCETGVVRHLCSRTLNLAYARVLDLPVRDISSGYRLYRREPLASLALESRHYEILEEIVIKLYAGGWTVGEIPFEYRPRRYGSSKARVVAFGIRMLRTLWRYWRLRNSLFFCDYDHRAYDSRVPPQRWWQRQRYARVLELVGPEPGPAPRLILDVGCGSSRILGGLPGRTVGLDMSMPKLRFLRRTGRALVRGDLNRLPFRSASADVIVCSEVIEHLPRVDFVELVRPLKPGGTLVVGTPDYGRWRWRAIEWVYARVIPGGYAEEHVNPFDRARLEGELRHAGIEPVEARYVGGAELIVKGVKRPAKSS